MKTLFLIPTVAVCMIPLALHAELPADDGPPQKYPGANLRREIKRRQIMQEQSPEIQKRFEAAREKALQDPKIQELRKKAEAAGKEFHDAMREAMLKVDPSLAEAFKENLKHERQFGKMNLSESDRQKLAAAREKAKDSPSVQAAEAKKRVANTPEERRAAMEEFHKAMREEILKADPSLQSILDHMPPMPPPPPPDEGPQDE